MPLCRGDTFLGAPVWSERTTGHAPYAASAGGGCRRSHGPRCEGHTSSSRTCHGHNSTLQRLSVRGNRSGDSIRNNGKQRLAAYVEPHADYAPIQAAKGNAERTIAAKHLVI